MRDLRANVPAGGGSLHGGAGNGSLREVRQCLGGALKDARADFS